MYGITLGSAECPIFYEDRNGKAVDFSLSETRSIIDSLLNRKDRNNGVGRHLFNRLRATGECRYDFHNNSEPLAFYCKSSEDGRYSIILIGTYPQERVARLNRTGQQSRAVGVTRSVQARYRQLRSQAPSVGQVKQKFFRTLAGENENLKLHFRNSEINCLDAITVIAKAARLEPQWVRTRLVRSLDERAVASLRLKGGFIFRVDLACRWRGLLDLSTQVQIRTTNDNTHGAYRRLRNILRKLLKLERKAQVAAQQKYLAAKKFQKAARRLFA